MIDREEEMVEEEGQLRARLLPVKNKNSGDGEKKNDDPIIGSATSVSFTII